MPDHPGIAGLLFIALAGSGCGRYADFTLPISSRNAASHSAFEFRPAAAGSAAARPANSTPAMP